MSLKLYAPSVADSHEDRFPCLSVYHEVEDAEEFAGREQLDQDYSSQVISWRFVPRERNQPSFMEIVQRSRLLHMHRHCRDCGRPTVQPVEGNDSVLGKNRLPVPGTSTVIGFHCDYCQSEWSA